MNKATTQLREEEAKAPAALLEDVVAGARPGELVDEVGHGPSIASASGNRDGVRAVSVRGGSLG